MKCSAPIKSPMRAGSCPTGFYDKPAPRMGWIGGMCFYAQSLGKMILAQHILSLNFEYVSNWKRPAFDEVSNYWKPVSISFRNICLSFRNQLGSGYLKRRGTHLAQYLLNAFIKCFNSHVQKIHVVYACFVDFK